MQCDHKDSLKWKRETEGKSESERERDKNAVLQALKLEEGTRSQGM